MFTFPRPVYEEPPFTQREKLSVLERERLMENSTSSRTDVMGGGGEEVDWDIPKFNALCRGDELRVRTVTNAEQMQEQQ